MATNQTTARSRPHYGGAGAGFNEDARQAVNSAFDALSNWREELTEGTERHSSAVFEKMAAAAKAMGWPSEFVEAARAQMQSASKLQLQIIDQVMDTWEQQLKNPGKAFALPNAKSVMDAFEQIPGMRGIGQNAGMPDFSTLAMNPMQFWMKMASGNANMPGFEGMPDMGSLSTNPMQFWMQAADMWQKNWATAVSSWMEMQNAASKGNGGSRPTR